MEALGGLGWAVFVRFSLGGTQETPQRDARKSTLAVHDLSQGKQLNVSQIQIPLLGRIT